MKKYLFFLVLVSLITGCYEDNWFIDSPGEDSIRRIVLLYVADTQNGNYSSMVGLCEAGSQAAYAATVLAQKSWSVIDSTQKKINVVIDSTGVGAKFAFRGSLQTPSLPIKTNFSGTCKNVSGVWLIATFYPENSGIKGLFGK